MTRRGLAILGATGSIGRQSVEIVRMHPDRFGVVVLTAHSQVNELISLAREFRPEVVVITDETRYKAVRDALQDLPIKVFAGMESLQWAVGISQVDLVLNAIVGAAGMLPTWWSVQERKPVALANKESLVVAGALIMEAANRYGVPIFPVDSEHSAIFQCMVGEPRKALRRIILTASGGPFRGWTMEQLANVNPRQALRHPNWKMGDKITIDSATLMNKGLEMIEAHWLFGIAPDQIEIVIHPQSIVHSMVEWQDGSVKAQLGYPDMRIPIAYALAFPDRLSMDHPTYDWPALSPLTFEAPDRTTFPALDLCYESIRRGGNLPCALNAANEVAVHCFLREEIRFTEIPEMIQKGIQAIQFIESPTIEQLLETDQIVRQTLSPCT